MTPAACLTPQQLEALLDDRLSPEEFRQADEHIRHCSRCPARLEELTRAREQAELPGLTRTEFETPFPALGQPAADTEREIPTSLSVGPCDLIRVLGRGGMGVVYEAQHREWNRRVALKVLAMPLIAQPTAAARFANEIQAMARLQHPGIVHVYDAGVWNPDPTQSPVPFAILELVSGLSLKEFLAEAGPLAPRAATGLVEAIARAVQHAHEKGVVHRDLKPANILLAGDSGQGSGVRKDNKADGSSLTTDHSPLTTLSPKVADFGLAKLLDENRGLTASRDLLGTPEYMAPELGAQGCTPDHRVDVYALGVILFECLTRQVPFRGPTAVQTLVMAQSRAPVVPSTLRSGIPPALDAIVLKCLAKEPDQRYPSAAALADALAGFLVGQSSPCCALVRPRNAFLALALAAVVGVAVLLLADHEPPSPQPQVPTEPPAKPQAERAAAASLSLENGDKFRCPKPAEFAIVFSLGYGKDDMPKDDTFDKLVGKLKSAGFNVIHCAYTDARLKTCKKYGVKMMVDLLAPEQHIYKELDAAKTLCGKLRGDAAVWGYDIWNDEIGSMAAGRKRDIANVRAWDPTHPAFCGTHRTDGMADITNADAIGFYDYHWKRNRDGHFPNLLRFAAWANERDEIVLRWVEADPGIPGQGNANRARYTLNTSVACGLKGILWFLGSKQIDMKTLEWTQTGKDDAAVNAEVMPLRAELMKIGNPLAIYSTAITKTANNDALPHLKKSMMPPGLEKNAFPPTFWMMPTAGEFVCGVFKDVSDKDAPDRLFLANHNAYVPQDVVFSMAKPRKVWMFDRKTGKWEPLAVKDGSVAFRLAPGGGELLRFE